VLVLIKSLRTDDEIALLVGSDRLGSARRGVAQLPTRGGRAGGYVEPPPW
jgi:hypothetical protein